MSRLITALLIGLLTSGCAMGLQRQAYLVKPGTDHPVHVVRCDDRPRNGGQWAATYLLPLGAFIGPALGYEQCLKERAEQGYIQAQEPECAYWRDDKEPGHQVVIREACKPTPPDWAAR